MQAPWVGNAVLLDGFYPHGLNFSIRDEYVKGFSS
jgi:hypothetical protein